MNGLFIKNFHRDERINHIDDSSHGADYYIGSRLTALRTVPIFSAASPTSKLIKTIAPKGFVGTVYSYVVDKNGLVWWMLDGGGYVLHQAGYFDTKDALNTSSGKQLADEAAQRAKDESESLPNVLSTTITKSVKGAGDLIGGAGDLLSGIGNNLKWIVIAVVVLGLIAVILKFR